MLKDLSESLRDLDEREETPKAVKEELPKLILKSLPTELKYAYMEENKQSPVVISSSLTIPQEDCLLEMEEEAKPVPQPQRRLNPHMQEVVRAEVLKLLQACIIYLISDSPWVSPTQVMLKKSGITVVQNGKGEEVSTCLTSDDITVYGSAFDECLVNLEAVLNRCIEKDLVLNWEKSHFMVHQGIVLGHIISKQGTEVDKAKAAKSQEDGCEWCPSACEILQPSCTPAKSS
ncbi:hypothetical protein CK203_055175 [Vitis vinifera]|uniref:Reverse transcriptase/retrotransposon-derived protein RNase H-like domain-containing protein n=1 Tax=Vitis vinifera TaxID=29760 RepID=A0A438GHS9_VITVI|nr:hypothetical protein CK203_055175 [Vitis vinifera]